MLPLPTTHHAELDQLAHASRRRQRSERQEPRLNRQRDVRRLAVDVCSQLQSAGHSLPRLAQRLGIPSRTLHHWHRREQQDQLTGRPLGRPAKESSPVQRRDVLQWINQVGPRLGLPALRTALPEFPCRELQDLKRDYVSWYRRTHRRSQAQLRWGSPGTVWAIDHSEPPQPIDGCYGSILAVRDLASGMQLAWLPVPDVTEATTAAVLQALFQEHGPPLVLKSDNGSAFISHEWGKLLSNWSVVPLRSPPVTPQYNGSCEAGIGSMKVRTIFLAASTGHPCYWTSDDLEGARQQANSLTCTRPGGPTHQQRWEQRSSIEPRQRDQLAAAIDRLRTQLLNTEELDWAKLNSQQQATIQRRVVSQALRELGLLSVTWRSIPLPLNAKKLAKIL